MTAANPLRVLLVGATHAPELAPAVAWLHAHCRCETAASARTRPFEPESIIICQARPGQVPREIVDNFHRTCPHSRLIALLGSMCEGEVRSGKPWPGVTRIYWHQWSSRLPRELTFAERGTVGRLPRTATEVDLLVSRPPPARAERPLLVGVVTDRRTDFEAIALTLAAGGHHGVWIVPGRAAPVVQLDALVLDGPISGFPRQLGWPPAIVLMGFPRPEEVRAISSSPQTEILAKPYSLADLLDRVAAVIETAAAAAPPRHCAA